MKIHANNRILLPSVLGATLLLWASVSMLFSQPAPTDGGDFRQQPGRYQFFAKDDGSTLFRLDTATGKVWSFASDSMKFATEGYLKEHFPDMTAEARAGILEDNRKLTGNIWCIPTHWELLPEKADGGLTLRNAQEIMKKNSPR